MSKHPQKTAFFYEQKTWKFQEVEDFSNRIANYFKSQGYKKGDKVALLLESCPEFVCIWLGLSKLGVITALINTNLKRDSLWHCVSAVEVKAMIFGTFQVLYVPPPVSPKIQIQLPTFLINNFKGLLGMEGKKRWSFFAVLRMQQSRSSNMSSVAVPLMLNLLQGISCNYTRGNIPALAAWV